MKYGLYYYKNTHNIGDDIWAYAQSLFYPHIDYLIDNTTVYKFKSSENEPVATILGAFIEPYNCEYAFLPPANIVPLFISSYFRPTMWEFLKSSFIKQYLKSYEPLGVRTYEQARIFCELGIEAYFSGCITLTLPERKKDVKKYICCVDVPDYIVDYVRKATNDEYEIKVMTHNVIEDTSGIAHRNLAIQGRFEIVETLLQTYTNAHCVVTSRIHAALPCLTQNTPVLLTVPKEDAIGVNDIKYRVGDFFNFFHHNFYNDFEENTMNYDFLCPPRNSSYYLSFRNHMINRCKQFIRDCENGNTFCFMEDTEFQRNEWLTDVLENKVNQLKNVVDSKNRCIFKLNERICALEEGMLKLQKRLRKYETFNEWESVEYFGDWAGRSQLMSRFIFSDCKSLLDLGCGEMHIRKFIKPDVKYYGCDYKKRDEDTIVCDLAKGEFPAIEVDAIFIAGCLEYLGNWQDVLKKCTQCCRQIIMSYATIESAPDRDKIWVTSLSKNEIINFLETYGFSLQESETVNTYEIFSFINLRRKVKCY